MTGAMCAIAGAGSFAPINAITAPSSVSGSRLGAGVCVSDSTTATASGGAGGFSYLWQYVSGDITVSAVNDTSLTTTFSSVLILGQTKNAVFRLRITDSLGFVGYSNNVDISLTETT